MYQTYSSSLIPDSKSIGLNMESKGIQQQQTRSGFDLKGIMSERPTINSEKKDEVERPSKQNLLPLDNFKSEYYNLGSQYSFLSNSSRNNDMSVISSNQHQSEKLRTENLDSVQVESSFKIGSKVEARNHETDDFTRGKILRVRFDGTVDVFCDNGKRLLGISKENIRMIISNNIKKEENSTNSLSVNEKSGNTEHVRFEIGTEVEARYRGKSQFYPGKIIRCRYDGSYDIHYNDGERELGVPRDLIRTPNSIENSQYRESSENLSGTFLNIGTEIEARYRGTNRYCAGKILRKRFDGTFDILYDDGERELGVSKAMIRLKEEASSSSNSKLNSVDNTDPFSLKSETICKKTEMSNLNNTSIRVSTNSTSTNDEDSTAERNYKTEELSNKKSVHEKHEATPYFEQTKFSIGDEVEAKFRGGKDFYTGKIHAVLESNFYSVAYDDGDFDERLNASDIRLINNETDSSATFKVGDEIEAIFGGSSYNQYYPGKIVRVHTDDKTFDIDYHDGDKEKRVPVSLIRKISIEDLQIQNNDQEVHVGDRVEARFRGTGSYYPGIISMVHQDNTVDVDYDDGDKDKRISLIFVKKLPVVAFEKEIPPEHNASNTNDDTVQQSTVDGFTHTRSTESADFNQSELIGSFQYDGFLSEIRKSIESIEKIRMEIVQLHETSTSGALAVHQMIRLVNEKEKEASQIVSIVSECLCSKIMKESFAIDNEYIEALKSHHSLMRCAVICKETLDKSAQENLDIAFTNFSRVYTKS